jgi:hypothetical protein
MQDKSGIILKAAREAGLPSWLCRWHGVRAFGAKVLKLDGLSGFLGDIMTLFKDVLAATTEVSPRHALF